MRILSLSCLLRPPDHQSSSRHMSRLGPSRCMLQLLLLTSIMVSEQWLTLTSRSHMRRERERVATEDEALAEAEAELP
jgi:hypothetical protein